MKLNDVLMIYKDPVRERYPEGVARLVKFVRIDEDVSTWKVRFIGSSKLCEREVQEDV